MLYNTLTILVCFCRCDKHHDQKQQEKERVNSILKLIVLHERKSGQGFEAGFAQPGFLPLGPPTQG